jgi:hypothetical protein
LPHLKPPRRRWLASRRRFIQRLASRLFNRTAGLNHAHYETLLFADRTLVKLWGQRGTLHVYATTDWPLVCAMLAERKSWWGRTAERTDTLDAYAELVTHTEALLREKGVMGRSDLRASGLITNEDHLSPWGGVFADLVRLGHACHAARDGEGLFAHRTVWRPDLVWELPDADAANLGFSGAICARMVRPRYRTSPTGAAAAKSKRRGAGKPPSPTN